VGAASGGMGRWFQGNFFQKWGVTNWSERDE